MGLLEHNIPLLSDYVDWSWVRATGMMGKDPGCKKSRLALSLDRQRLTGGIDGGHRHGHLSKYFITSLGLHGITLGRPGLSQAIGDKHLAVLRGYPIEIDPSLCTRFEYNPLGYFHKGIQSNIETSWPYHTSVPFVYYELRKPVSYWDGATVNFKLL